MVRAVDVDQRDRLSTASINTRRWSRSCALSLGVVVLGNSVETLAILQICNATPGLETPAQIAGGTVKLPSRDSIKLETVSAHRALSAAKEIQAASRKSPGHSLGGVERRLSQGRELNWLTGSSTFAPFPSGGGRLCEAGWSEAPFRHCPPKTAPADRGAAIRRAS